jgi:hypothetical protein
MRKIVLRYGIGSGLVLMGLSAVTLPLCLSGKVDSDKMEVVGYASMVLAFLLVYFGIRSYRETQGGGAISFGKALQVGLLITLITCAMYVVSWEITYFNFFPDFLENYSAHALARLRESGASEEKIAQATEQLAFMAKHYHNILFNSAVTFLEVFPVGLVVTLVSAALLRRRPATAASASP